MILPQKYYDILKWLAMIGLPALGTLYFGLSSIWGWPLAKEIVGTITTVDAFLGIVLGISSSNYNKELEKQVAEQRMKDAI